MNFDKFRQIDMPDVDAQADPTYIKKLNRLPDERKNPLPVILTVCAAVILVAAVGMWMLIGGAIRNQGEHTADPLDSPEDTTTTEPEPDKSDEEQKYPLTLELKDERQKFEKIAKEYHFSAMHEFEEGTLPHYVRSHVVELAWLDIHRIEENGVWFHGISLDDYNEAVIKYYGKSDMEGKTPIKIDDPNMNRKYSDLIQASSGVYVSIEVSGGLDTRLECTDVQYGTTKSGEKCVSVTYNEYYIGNDDTAPNVRTVCYTTDDNLTPKQFVSCSIKTPEPTE